MNESKRQARLEARSRLKDLGSRRTLVGVALFLLLSATAMGVLAVFAQLGARQNAAALVYESAVGRLQLLIRGINDAALTEGSLASLLRVASARKAFDDVRNASEGLKADTADLWPDLDRAVGELMRDRRNIAFDEDAQIEMGRIVAAVEKLEARLELGAAARRRGAESAGRRVQVMNLAAAALLILGTAGAFIIRDSVARKVVAGARASEARLRQITDAVSAMIVYVDGERRFRFHNKAIETTMGLRAEEIDGRTVREVFGNEVYETLRPWIDQALAGIPVRFVSTRKNALGDVRDYAVHYFPRRRDDDEGQPVIGYYGLATDITETKRIDRMKTEFVSTVSHELRTPLTSIRGSLGLLAGGVAGPLPAAAENLVEIATANCERLIRLINDILDTEKIESGRMRMDLKVLELKALVQQALAATEGFSSQHQVRLVLRAPEGAMRASVDADRFIQVVTNLLSNAIKFSPAHGAVEVTLSREAERARIEVRDRGPGIPAEFRGRIFERFSQADSSDRRAKGGSGLGLNISKAIVESLGGTIGFTTEPGRGTTFFFMLPEWRDAHARSDNAAWLNVR